MMNGEKKTIVSGLLVREIRLSIFTTMRFCPFKQTCYTEREALSHHFLKPDMSHYINKGVGFGKSVNGLWQVAVGVAVF